MWITLAHAADTLGELPPADVPAVWVAADPGCPWSRTWLADLLAVPDPAARVVVVTPAPLAEWRRLVDERGWSGLTVVSDPDRSLTTERVGPQDRFATTGLWTGGERVWTGIPESLGDPVAEQIRTFVRDPATPLGDPPKYSPLMLLMYAEFGPPRFALKVAREVARPTDPGSAWLALEVARILAQRDERQLDRADALVAAAKVHLPDEPVVDALAAELHRARTGAEAAAPPVGPATVTGDQLAQDLTTLNTWLRTFYSGYEGMDEDLRAGGGWEAHHDAHVALARAQATWAWADAAAFVADRYLAPVNDSHFGVRGASDDGATVKRWLSDDGVAWFTDLVLDADGVVVAGPDGWLGRTPALDLVPTAPVYVPGAAVKLPTRLASGAPGFLVGTVAVGDVTTLDVDGEPLPVHRSRSALRTDQATGPWTLTAGDVPVLAVRTMDPDALGGLPDTAAGLRARPRVIVDLRGNSGGSDEPAIRWISGFTSGTFHQPTVAMKTPVGWYSERGGDWSPRDAPPYEGQLFVLVDKDVCSSGETFAFLGAQVPGATLVGENTSGCLRNGEVRSWPPLPNTKLRTSFGTKSFRGEGLPAAEGAGVFPEVWLDVDDPLGFLAALPAR